MDKYFVIEIEVMKDGAVAKAISDGKARDEAISQFHQTLASAVINDNVKSVFVEVKDCYGNSVAREYDAKPEPEPTPEVEE